MYSSTPIGGQIIFFYVKTTKFLVIVRNQTIVASKKNEIFIAGNLPHRAGDKINLFNFPLRVDFKHTLIYSRNPFIVIGIYLHGNDDITRISTAAIIVGEYFISKTN